MGVKKIFLVLITIVGCVLIGAFVLNILLPNASETLVNSTEDMIFKATGLSFDINNDGTAGKNNSTYTGTQTNSTGNVGNSTVDGFK